MGDERLAGTPDGELRSRLAAIVESSVDAILGKTLDGVITDWNAAAEQIYGYTRDEIIGHNVSEIVPPDRADELAAIMARLRRGERVGHFETLRRRKDGTIIDVSVSISPIRDGAGHVVGAATVARDISERKRAEAERLALQTRLRQAERMEIAGQLAGGIAHNYRNLIGVISGYAVLLEDEAGDNPEIQPVIRDIQGAADKADRLASDLLGVGRPNQVTAEAVDLSELLSGISHLLQAGLGARIRLQMRPDPGLPPVHASAGQIEQVLLNLAVNARDAMPRGGTLTITAGLAEPTAPPEHQPSGTPVARDVWISVSDTGTGMPPQVADRVFDPFFTTRPDDGGTGLGLFTVHQIITQLGGDIEVRSRESAGTTFTIRLPAACGPVSGPSSADDCSRTAHS
jgi:PAS domain S-box-containing protein